MYTVFKSARSRRSAARDKESTVKPQSKQFGTGSLVEIIYKQLFCFCKYLLLH